MVWGAGRRAWRVGFCRASRVQGASHCPRNTARKTCASCRVVMGRGFNGGVGT